jgi:rare lipoprotein A
LTDNNLIGSQFGILCLGAFVASLIGTASSAAASNCQATALAQQQGIASWYGAHYDGRKTSSGRIFHMNAMTAAHPTLPLGSVVRVINTLNQRSVTVRVTDRGPFVGNRILDVSSAAAESLGFRQNGIAMVSIIPNAQCASKH